MSTKSTKSVVQAAPSSGPWRVVVVQKWEESERGWGTRPDGYSIHLTEYNRKRFIEEHNKKLPDDHVPDEYSRPCGTPYNANVDTATYDELVRASEAGKYGTRGHGDYPGSGGTDGWVAWVAVPARPGAKTKADIEAILRDVRFLDREFVLTEKGDGFLLQVTYWEADVDTGKKALQKSRKWYVSPWATETEVVDAAFACAERSWGHVLREHFTYRGRRVFSPHFSIESRMRAADPAALDARPDDRPGRGER